MELFRVGGFCPQTNYLFMGILISILFSLLFLIIIFQVTLSIAVSTLSKHFCSFSLSKFAIRIVSRSYAATTNLDKSRKSMGFTTNVRGNTEVVMSGDGVAKSLITSLLQLLWMEGSFVFMGVWVPIYRVSTRWGDFTQLPVLLITLYKIRAIDRKQEVPHDGAMCDLLWSDPDGTLTKQLLSTHNSHTHTQDIPGWGLSPRGAGFLFGADITKAFAYNNAIDLIARAHQLAMDGFKLMFDQTIVTVWSAPNYCYRWASPFYSVLPLTTIIDRCGNVASILELDEHLGQEYKVFQHAPIVCIHLLPVGSGTTNAHWVA